MVELIDFSSRKAQSSPPKVETWSLLTLDEAFRGVIVAWIHLHDTKRADEILKYVLAGYNAGDYVIEVPDSLWGPVQEETYQTIAQIKKEVKASLQIQGP